jgi:hypothetical protein
MRGKLGHFTFVVLLRAAHPPPLEEDLLAFPRSSGDIIPNSGRVADSGPGIKTCQTLARHSTPSLTIGRYAKTTPRDIKGAVESLPNPTSIRPKSDAADLAVYRRNAAAVKQWTGVRIRPLQVVLDRKAVKTDLSRETRMARRPESHTNVTLRLK